MLFTKNLLKIMVLHWV